MNDATPPSEIAIPPDRGGAVVIDIDAVVANYRLYQELAGSVAVAAALKADAYGLGIERVAPALADAGCQVFFVALPCEGITLRRLVPGAHIVVLSGPEQASAPVFVQHRLAPALNSLTQITEWQQVCTTSTDTEAAVLHLDTGMARLGLSADEIERLVADPSRLDGIRLQCVLSHLACADVPDHPMNARQRSAFVAATEVLEAVTGKVPRSLANSSGAFLGPDYHFDMVRPGAALYGINPTPHRANPMHQTVRLLARVIQVRDVDAPQTVGYGAAHQVTRPSRIATIAIGYGDGYMRAVGSIANSAGAQPRALDDTAGAKAYIGETAVPVVGRVSMDLITLDVSSVAPDRVRPGAIVELMGDHNPVDELARWAGTIGYEILTGLGPRLHRIYSGGAR